jgi:LytS/YehU family sensor histidine kinase
MAVVSSGLLIPPFYRYMVGLTACLNRWANSGVIPISYMPEMTQQIL